MKKLTKQGLPGSGGHRGRQRSDGSHKASVKKPMRLGDVLKDALSTSRLNIDMDLFAIWNEWDALVGPVTAKHTRPDAIKGKLLLVNVSSAPWMQELQFLKEEIIVKLNESLGREAIRDIKFQIGPVVQRSP